MPNNLTDAEIKKALKQCETQKTCCGCSYFEKIGCKKHLYQDALDLINRLEDKCKAYKHYYDECLKDLKNANAENESLKAEVERLKANEEMAEGYADALVEYTKSEAYKEFAERLKHIIMWSPKNHISITAKDIDNLLNELVGDGDA